MSHWTDEQFAAALLGEPGDDAHLLECAACRGELERLRAVTRGVRRDAEAAAEQSEIFWQRQRAAIRVQLASSARRPNGWAWATAVAAVLLLAIALGQPVQPPADTAQKEDADHLLLLEIGRSLERQVPRALEPAALLTQELDRAVETQRNP
jgi:hypothetical protein